MVFEGGVGRGPAWPGAPGEPGGPRGPEGPEGPKGPEGPESPGCVEEGGNGVVVVLEQSHMNLIS